jgi:hypothetical protein
MSNGGGVGWKAYFSNIVLKEFKEEAVLMQLVSVDEPVFERWSLNGEIFRPMEQSEEYSGYRQIFDDYVEMVKYPCGFNPYDFSESDDSVNSGYHHVDSMMEEDWYD